MQNLTGPPRLNEVADGVYAFLQPNGGWCLNNSGVIVNANATALVDTAPTQARAMRLRELAAEVTAISPQLIVNTHAHGDHTFGNFVFPDAIVIGNERTRSESIEAGLHLMGLWPAVNWGAIELVPPAVTFSDTMTLHLGDQVAELRSFGPAHSSCDTVVWLPQQRVLFAGDLVLSGVTPLILTGSISGLRTAVAALSGLGAETIVPGHGAVGGPELLNSTERYLTWLMNLAQAGLAAGLAPFDIAQGAELGEFAEFIDRERLVPNLYRACDELRGIGQGNIAQVDEIFQAMVKLHGGLPACHA